MQKEAVSHGIACQWLVFYKECLWTISDLCALPETKKSCTFTRGSEQHVASMAQVAYRKFDGLVVVPDTGLSLSPDPVQAAVLDSSRSCLSAWNFRRVSMCLECRSVSPLHNAADVLKHLVLRECYLTKRTGWEFGSVAGRGLRRWPYRVFYPCGVRP